MAHHRHDRARQMASGAHAEPPLREGFLYLSMVKVAVLARPERASMGASVCISRLGAALRTRVERPSTSDPSGRPCLSS